MPVIRCKTCQQEYAVACFELVKVPKEIQAVIPVGHNPVGLNCQAVIRRLMAQAKDDALYARAVGYPVESIEMREHDLH